jgi:hypothetical protein
MPRPTTARARAFAEPTPAAALALAELRGRCRVDDEGHWLWVGANSDGYPRIWAPDHTNHRGAMKSQHGRRAVWHLRTGKAIPNGWRVFSTCGVRACINPAHLVCEPTAKHGEKVAASGQFKGVVARIVANRAIGRKRSQLTPELIEVIRSSDATGEALAAELKLHRNIVSKVRNRKALSFDAVGGVFTGLLAMNDGAARRSA